MTPDAWPRMVRRSGDAAALALQGVGPFGLAGLRAAVGLVYGDAVADSAAGLDLMEVVATLGLAIGLLADRRGQSVREVVDDLVEFAESAGSVS